MGVHSRRGRQTHDVTVAVVAAVKHIHVTKHMHATKLSGHVLAAPDHFA